MTSKKKSEQTGKTKSTKREAKHAKQIDELNSEIAELTEDVKRERADFMNYKRRMELDRMQIMQTAKSEIVTDLLGVFDDLERALSAAPEDISDHPWVKGVEQVHKQVQAKLSSLGVERIDCLNQPFNPELHEAVGFEGGEGDDEVVIEELRPGYRIGESMLRPSMVKVGKPLHEDGTVNKSKEDK